MSVFLCRVIVLNEGKIWSNFFIVILIVNKISPKTLLLCATDINVLKKIL